MPAIEAVDGLKPGWAGCPNCRIGAASTTMNWWLKAPLGPAYEVRGHGWGQPSHYRLLLFVVASIQNGHERFLRDVDTTNRLHPLLAFLLLLPELSLS